MGQLDMGVSKGRFKNVIPTFVLVFVLFCTSCASVGPQNSPDYPYDGAMNDSSTAAHYIQLPRGASMFPDSVLFPVSYEVIEPGSVKVPDNFVLISPDESIKEANVLVYVGRESAEEAVPAEGTNSICNYYLTFLYHQDERESGGGHLIGYWGQSTDKTIRESHIGLINECYVLANKINKTKSNFSPYMPSLEYETTADFSDTVSAPPVIVNDTSADLLIRIGKRDNEYDYVEFLCSTKEKCVVSWRIVYKDKITNSK